MKVSVIIPNYNGEELLKKNLPLVFEVIKKYGDIEVIIVDDKSSDNSLVQIKNARLKIKNENLKIKVIENEKNLGFSSSVNCGVGEATGEFVVLLNTDVVPEKNFLDPILEDFELDEKLFAVGCMDKSIEDGKTVFRGRGIGAFKRGFLVHARGEVDKNDTFWVSGGSGAFRRKVWEDLGGFDELYNPFYWEDIDLSYRAQKAGYSVLFEKKSKVIHEHAEGSIKRQFTDAQIKTIAYRNQFIFVWKNITDLQLLFFHFFWLPIQFMQALWRLDLSFLQGFFFAALKIPVIINRRKKLKKLFKKKDNEIINHYSSI